MPNDALRRRITSLVSAIVLAVGDGAGRSSGETYALLLNACNLELYNDVIGLCVASDILTDRGHWLTLTTKGKALLADVRKLAA